MWPRRTTAVRHLEKRPLLAAEPVDDGPLVAGCGKKIGVKAQGMGYVVVDSPVAAASASGTKQRHQSPPRRPGAPPSALQQWGAVAAALVNNLRAAPRAPWSAPAAASVTPKPAD